MDEAKEISEKRFWCNFLSLSFFFGDKGERVRKMKKEKERMNIQNRGLETDRAELGAPPSCLLDVDTTFSFLFFYLINPPGKSILKTHLSHFVAFCRILSHKR
jgi:hypothetical protein